MTGLGRETVIFDCGLGTTRLDFAPKAGEERLSSPLNEMVLFDEVRTVALYALTLESSLNTATV